LSGLARGPMLGRRELLDLFGELDALLAGDVAHELLVVGGAAMALRWEGRLSDDVDVVDVPIPAEVQTAVRALAEEQGLSPGWLNAGAAAFAPNMQADATVVYRGQRLVVRAAGAEYLLAMKLRASRDQDLDDAVLLARATGRTTRETLYELIAEGYWRGTIIADLEGFVGEVLEGLAADTPELDAPYGAPEPPGLDI